MALLHLLCRRRHRPFLLHPLRPSSPWRRIRSRARRSTTRADTTDRLSCVYLVPNIYKYNVYIYLCIYRYIYIKIHVCMNIYIYICIYLSICLYIYISIYIYIYICIYIYVRIWIYIDSIHTYPLRPSPSRRRVRSRTWLSAARADTTDWVSLSYST